MLRLHFACARQNAAPRSHSLSQRRLNEGLRGLPGSRVITSAQAEFKGFCIARIPGGAVIGFALLSVDPVRVTNLGVVASRREHPLCNYSSREHRPSAAILASEARALNQQLPVCSLSADRASH